LAISLRKRTRILFISIFVSTVIALSQMIEDPIGDIQIGDPKFVDIEKVKFWQSAGALDRMTIDFYTNAVIPKGNQAGIEASTIFEVYIDADDDSTTGIKIEDIGYDYKIHVDLYDWNGKNWIDGSVYWGFDTVTTGGPQSGFFIFAEGNPRISSPYRFRWPFSLIGLKWPKISWVARTYYYHHLSDQIPDQGHASLEIDTAGVANIDTACGEHIKFIYPTSFQDKMDTYEVLNAIDFGAMIESHLCGTEFHGVQVVQFNPWIEGVAYCGNPVSIGSWMWEEPPWFIVFHELGHNYTLAAERFKNLYPSLGYDTPMGGDESDFGTNFVEAWASMVGLYSMYEMFTERDQFQLSYECRSNLEQNFNDMRNSFIGQLNDYEKNPNYHVLNPDLLDGIFMSLGEEYGYTIFPDFFKVLQPYNQTWDLLTEVEDNITTDYNYAKTIAMTVTCCSFSVAAGLDLRDRFRDQWDFPIDDNLYNEIEPEITSMITAIDDDFSVINENQFILFPNYPNPFNANTVISYQMDRPSPVKIKIYNMLGQQVKMIYEGYQTVGNHQLTWDATGISSGAYVIFIETNQCVKSIKCLLLQ